jgi:hypothetical protein
VPTVTPLPAVASAKRSPSLSYSRVKLVWLLRACPLRRRFSQRVTATFLRTGSFPSKLRDFRQAKR